MTQEEDKIPDSRDLSRKMLDLRRKVNVGGIRDLDDALRLAREILTSPNLDESMQAQAQELEDKARAKRAVLKTAFGEVETMAGLGHLKGAISRLEDFINKDIFEFENREGRSFRPRTSYANTTRSTPLSVRRRLASTWIAPSSRCRPSPRRPTTCSSRRWSSSIRPIYSVRTESGAPPCRSGRDDHPLGLGQ